MKILYCESRRSLTSLIEVRPNDEVEYWGVRYVEKSIEWFKRYDVVVCSNFTSPAMFSVMLKAKACGVVTLFLTDGIYEVANSLRNPNLVKYGVFLYDYSIYDYIFALGPVHVAKTLDSTKIIQYIPRRVMNWDDDMKRLNSGYSSEVKVLVTTANTAYFSQEEKNRLAALINEVLFGLRALEDVGVVLRIFDESLYSLIKSDAVNCLSGTFEDSLEGVTHVITTPSSISLPVIKREIPLMHMITRSEVPVVFAGWQVASKEIFFECIDEFLYESEVKVGIQSDFFKNSYHDSVEKGWALIEEDASEFRCLDVHLKKRVESFYSSRMNLNFEYVLRRMGELIRNTPMYKNLRNWIK